MTIKITPVPALLCLAVILVCSLIIAGCTSPATPEKSTPVTTSVGATAVPTTVSTPAAPAEPVMATPAITSARLASSVFSNVTYGLTIAYPADWQKEELSELGLRDYGRTTLNIANIYSPDITAERKKLDGPNPDPSTYTTLSIDVDQVPVTDFEQYFNLVTLALQKTYGTITITKHNYQLDISKTDAKPEGYDAYQLDFDTKTMRAKYIFVDVDDTIYIFAFRNPSPYSSEVEEMYKSIVITPGTSSAKHR